MLQEDREKALRKRALLNTEKLDIHTRQLAPLHVQDVVQVQNQLGFKASRWDVTGVIVEVKPHDQYMVKVHGSGRLTLRNRRFLKKISPYCQDTKRPDVLIQPQPLIADDASHGQPQAQHEPVQREDRVQAEPLEDHSSTTGLPPAPAQDQPPPASPPLPASVQPPLGTPDSPPVVRRSTRERVEPQRLNVESWKGKSYDTNRVGSVHHIDHISATQIEPGLSGQYGTWYYSMTAPYSVVHYHGLPLSVPGGGGGISGYAWVSPQLPCSYQAKYLPWTTVHSPGHPGSTQLYYSGHQKQHHS